jgi:hypothetical protein
LVEPGRDFQPGDEVVVGLKDGTRMVRELAFQEEGRVGLDAIPYRQDRIEVAEAEVAYLHLVTGILYGRRAASRQA